VSDELDARAHALLQAVVTGERAASDPEVAALARASAAFGARLRELVEAAELLERAAREERATRRDAERIAHAPGESALGRPPARRGPRRARIAVLVALTAAGVALGLWLVRARASDGREPPLWLGEGTVRILRPRGAVGSYAPIEWQGRLSPRGEYRITILDATGVTPAGAALLEHRTTDTRWTPSAEELERLPARVRVEVAIFDDGYLQNGDRAEAWR